MQEQNQMTKTTNYKFRTTLKEEKETIINFDYEEEVIHLYSTNQSTCKKLLKKIGTPIKIDYVEQEISSMEWKIAFRDRETIRKGLSITNFVTNYISNK